MKFLAPIAVAATLMAAPLLPHAQAQQPAPVAAAVQAPRWTAADSHAVLNARLAALRTVVGMTPEQERLWVPVEAAIREIVQSAATRGAQSAPTSPGFLDVLGAIADAEEARARDLRKFVEAARPFVASLSEAQKRRIPAFLGMTDHGGLQPSASLWIFEEEEG